MLGTLADWGMRPPVVVADAAYGTNGHLRAGPAERGIDYVLAVRSDVSAHPFEAEPVAPARNGPIGCWLQPRYRQAAPSVAALATSLGQEAFAPLTWRNGSRGELRSRFAAVRVRPAGKAVERPVKAAVSAEQGWWDRVLPDCWLLVEWPADADAPTDYWLSNLPADTPRPIWSVWPRSAGASSTTAASSSTASAWTTSKAAPGPAGTTTSPSSPPPTPSSPSSAWPQRSHTGLTLYQILDTLQGTLKLLDRRLQHLPSSPTRQATHDSKTQIDLTEFY